MSMQKSQKQPLPVQESAAIINFDSILSQDAYVTNLNEFLSEKDNAKALQYWINKFIPAEQLTSSTAIRHEIFRAIANIDEFINNQLNLIIHHPKFQKLEASWRGLWLLAKQDDKTKKIKIKVLDISWSEVVKDIGNAKHIDQSHLYNEIYKVYDTPGAEPYSILIGDYEISHRISEKHPHDDLATLSGIAKIAAAALAPFIAAPSSDLFGMEDFSGLGHSINLEEIFRQPGYEKWYALRKKTDARFVGLTLPKILMRPSYGKKPGNYKGVYFYEKTDIKGNSYLWGNACYAFAAILIREFNRYGWFEHIRGAPRGQSSGGLVTTQSFDSFNTDSDAILPHESFDTDSKAIAHKPVTNVVITDAAEKIFSALGFVPLCQGYLSPNATFYNNESLHQSKKYHEDDEAYANTRLSTMLQHILCGSHIAHYIKVMARDKVGLFNSAVKCEKLLEEWLHKITDGREDLDWEQQAKRPLKKATVRVKKIPSKPGKYNCVIHLQPHYQLDQMVSELELVTELTSSSQNLSH